MADSCCICGLVLATNDSDFPRWCKEIRALYLSDERPVLSDVGYIDNDVMPFNLGLKRFCYRRSLTEIEDFQDYCYPFHASCWSLLQESDSRSVSENEVNALFNIFESFHYDRNARALKWGQGYCFEDILDPYCSQEPRGLHKDIVAMHKDDMAILADPLHFDLRKDEIAKRGTTIPERLKSNKKRLVPVLEVTKMDLGLLVCGVSILYTMKNWHLQKMALAPIIALPVIGTVFVYCREFYHLRSRCSTSHLLSLPSEIFESILLSLDLDDVQHLLISSAVLYRRYGRGGVNLPSLFWESRFWAQGEMVFARANRLSTYSWREWVFTIKSEMRAGPNRMNLRNRKRIWKLGTELTTLVHTINNPDRVLRCDISDGPPDQMRGPTASCLALNCDSDGCRELKQIYISLSGVNSRSRSCAFAQSYVFVSGQRLLSGITISFGDGHQVDAGYVRDMETDRTNTQFYAICPKFLWVVFCSSGVIAMTLDTCSQAFFDTCMSSHGHRLAVARWPWDRVQGIYLGLDAMRIVRITIDSPQPPALEDLSWTPPLPFSVPSIDKGDLNTLYELQRKSFTPASTACIDPQMGRLSIIIVYSPLGRQAGITGIRFIYDTGVESIWGTSDDTASLAFFLGDAEQLIKVKVYKVGSLVSHLQFFTNFRRLSDLFPQPQVPSNASMNCIEHVASDDGYIIGFCGCFLESSRQLNCFGVLATTCSVALPLSSSIPETHDFEWAPRDTSLGSIRNHGIQRSGQILLERYYSVQASINPVTSRYRNVGQVTGLAFRSGDHARHPDLLGQWTGIGKTHYFKPNEWILDLVVTTIKPRLKQIVRSGLSQVESITIVTNLRSIRWGPSTALPGEDEDKNPRERKHTLTKVLWDFNAIFDQVQCIYK